MPDGLSMSDVNLTSYSLQSPMIAPVQSAQIIAPMPQGSSTDLFGLGSITSDLANMGTQPDPNQIFVPQRQQYNPNAGFKI